MSGANGKLNGHGHHVKPENWDPILMCQGSCRSPSKHLFKYANPLTPTTVLGDVTVYYHLIYSCQSCGNERVYGLQSSD